MFSKIAYPVIIGLCIATITASGKAFVDVIELKTENKFITYAIKQMHEDIKTIKNHLIKEKRK